MTLSTFSPIDQRGQGGIVTKKSFRLEEMLLEVKKDQFTNSIPITDLKKTEYNCNWLPCLNALNTYSSINHLILLSTISDKNNDGSIKSIGSFDQIKEFRIFINEYYKNSNRKIIIENHIETKLMSKEPLIKKTENGISANNSVEFSKVALDIMDGLEGANKKDNPSYLEEIACS